MLKADADRKLDRVRALKANLEGRRDQLERRHTEVVATVSMAKARVAARPDTDLLLEALQRETHDKNIGNYSRLLTALCRDVLRQDVEIGLDLSTERGLAAMDIFAKRGERRSDIMENCGGSLTNVVCMGLRAIATERSGLRKFLAFDEPDCWLEPDKIPGFFGVLSEMARRLGIQILVITHHSLSSLGPDVKASVIEVTGTPQAGLKAARLPNAPGWPDADAPGLRSVALRNFSSFADAEIPLSPGLNLVIGANNIGKSRLMRALRSVAYGSTDSSDEDIRDGARAAEVDIVMEGGRRLSWSRQPKRNPVSLWRLTGSDGTVVMDEQGGAPCETGGKQVPEWVPRTLGIARVDGLDIQLAHQKLPVFLLDKPASQRAMVLSVGNESSLLRDMIGMSKEDRTRDAATVKAGEQEVARLREQLSALEDLVGIGIALDRAIEAGLECARLQDEADEAERACAALDGVSARLSRARALVAATDALPDELDLSSDLAALREAEASGIGLARTSAALSRARALVAATDALPDQPPEPPTTDAAAALADTLDATSAALARSRAVLAALEGLPDGEPSQPETDAMERAADAAAALSSRLAEARLAAADATRGETEAALEISDLLAGLGNLCPMCGTPGIQHDHVLNAETHR